MLSGILRSKLFAYGVVSTGIAAALVSHVYNQRQNFYSAAVQMHRSTGSAIVSPVDAQHAQRGEPDVELMQYDVERSSFRFIDPRQFCGISLYTHRIPLQVHILWDSKDNRSRGGRCRVAWPALGPRGLTFRARDHLLAFLR